LLKSIGGCAKSNALKFAFQLFLKIFIGQPGFGIDYNREGEVLCMQCRVVDLRFRDVINIKDGCRLGCVNDIEIDTCSARVLCIVIFGRPKCFGLLGREEDIIIPWDNIEVIGEDTVLVCFSHKFPPKRKRFFEKFLQ